MNIALYEYIKISIIFREKLKFIMLTKLKDDGKFLDVKTDRENRPRKYEDALMQYAS